MNDSNLLKSTSLVSTISSSVVFILLIITFKQIQIQPINTACHMECPSVSKVYFMKNTHHMDYEIVIKRIDYNMSDIDLVQLITE